MIGNSQKPTSLQWLAMGTCGFFLALVIWGIATSSPNRTEFQDKTKKQPSKALPSQPPIGPLRSIRPKSQF